MLRPVAGIEATPAPELTPGGPGKKPPSRLLAEGDPLETGKAKILAFASAERKLRTSGVAEGEIAAGRARQAAGLMAGRTPEEMLAGAGTGPLRQTVARAPDLTPAEAVAIRDNVIERAKAAGSVFDVFHVLDTVGSPSTLTKMLTPGAGLQPAEIDWIARTFGDDVARAMAERPKLPSTVAH